MPGSVFPSPSPPNGTRPPPPPVRPLPQPAPVQATPAWIKLAVAVQSVAMVAVLGFVLWGHVPHPGPTPGPEPSPSPAPAAVAAGKAYAAKLSVAYADALNAYADAVEAGKSMDEASKAIPTTFHANSYQSFQATIQPVLEPLIDDKKEPKDRKAYARAIRDVASGLTR